MQGIYSQTMAMVKGMVKSKKYGKKYGKHGQIQKNNFQSMTRVRKLISKLL